jgi:hypothetical protein
MARYDILIQETSTQLCSKGRHHLQQVRCQKGFGALVVVTAGRLRQMMAAGDTFTLVGEEEPAKTAVAVVEPCECGDGYILKPEGIVHEFLA